LDKKTSDENVLQALQTDAGFVSSYPKLKQVLQTIFALTNTEDKTAVLEKLKAIQVTDWDTTNADAQWTKINKEAILITPQITCIIYLSNEPLPAER